jgi:hypothetical protein
VDPAALGFREGDRAEGAFTTSGEARSPHPEGLHGARPKACSPHRAEGASTVTVSATATATATVSFGQPEWPVTDT